MKKFIKKISIFVTILTLVFSSLIPNIANADSVGPNSPGADAANTAVCADNMVWSDPGVGTSANDTTYMGYTAGNFDSGNPSDGIDVTTFGFSLGAGVASIEGITVEVLGWTNNGGTANYLDVFLLAGGARRGEDRASGALPTSDPGSTYQSFGGATDDWYAGGSWTQSEIEATDFGVALCWSATANNTHILIDHVRITVHYTVAGAVAPTVTTNDDTSLGVTSATLNGTVSNDGGDPATTVGFAYGTDSNFLTNTATTSETGTFATSATFDQPVSGLLAGITYYFRAYATNSVGTSFGGSQNFTTGTDTSITRRLRLFEGFIIKLLTGKIIIHQGW